MAFVPVLLRHVLIAWVFVIAVQATEAGASCEGAMPSELLTAWYDPVSKVLIKEEGVSDDHYRESRFLWLGPQQHVEIFETAYLSGNPGSISSGDEATDRVYDDILDDPPVLKWQDDVGASLPGPVVHWRDAARAADLVTGGGSMPDDRKRLERFESIVRLSRKSIAQEASFSLLEEQAGCPYRVKNIQGNLIVFRKYRNGLLGLENFLWSQIPGDDRTATRVTKTRCFGQGSKPDFLAVHWVWECQGEGDVMLPIENGKVGPRADRMP